MARRSIDKEVCRNSGYDYILILGKLSLILLCLNLTHLLLAILSFNMQLLPLLQPQIQRTRLQSEVVAHAIDKL